MHTAEIGLLEPQVVWRHFQTLCNIPRPSKHEQVLRDYLQQWAIQRGLDTEVDEIGNLVIRKPATQGMEKAIPVILQGHLDMVTQANRDTPHDFLRDPIQPIIEEGWLVAKHTTLGADNGIGVALALAVLESDDVAHGAIEVLLTVDEEAGMSGARFLSPNILHGQWLINIDTEQWGELYLGCAGSQDVEVNQTAQFIAAPPNLAFYDVQILGLKGGHSGLNIHEGRGNANVILAQFLANHLAKLHGHLVAMQGGTARNAIAREASATIAIPINQLENLQTAVQNAENMWRERLQNTDGDVQIQLQNSPQKHAHILEEKQQQQWFHALASCPYGVAKLSQSIADIVETSNNIGVVKVDQNGLITSIMVRSLVNSDAGALAERIQQHFISHDCYAELTPLVSGWTPNPDSQALACLQQAYRDVFGIEAKRKVIHAGLECGIIAEHYPHLEMVSFGPDIRGAHAPGERVNIHTVAQCWQLLKSALANVPNRSAKMKA
ncbi:dipeptidase D [Acinetobacter marinus]|uniref:Cytosol non-specific dipeptidase n=1 Tax=Acinetobacter marinus TaxID=281375 RepID=A0A1G6MX83_9GAMM|nr:aminoacyl-histidine dipeptidase [Acinetobacter marinus]SDC59844.1 dipeptidase D [Acinetobacter marinus]